jgi:hypothetical protein
MRARPMTAICGLTIAFLALGVAGPASANWSIGTITNRTQQTISVSMPIAPGQTGTAAGYSVRGNLAIVVPGQGPILFLDKGHNSPCSRPYWGVAVTYQTQKWGIFYDGGGTFDVTVNADGSISFTPGPNTQVVSGTGPPQCH